MKSLTILLLIISASMFWLFNNSSNEAAVEGGDQNVQLPHKVEAKNAIRPQESSFLNEKSGEIKFQSPNHWSPADKYEMYKVIQKCVTAKDSYNVLKGLAINHPARENIFHIEEATREYCKGLSENDIRSRIGYLKEAALENIPGAGVEYFRVGPFGDLSAAEVRPDDPLVKEWAKDAEAYLLAAGKRGDIAALSTLSHIYQQGAWVPKSNIYTLGYELAAQKIEKSKNVSSPSRDRLIKIISHGMKEGDIDQANKLASDIFSVCCSGR